MYFSCKANIVGRACDVCAPGYFAFPYCEHCECNLSGTTSEICDQSTAECFCKKYVIGPRCEYCKEGTFNLEDDNEDGCTECFCFGKTTRCSSSNYFVSTMSMMKNWSIVTLDSSNKFIPLNKSAEELNDNMVSLNLNLLNIDENDVIYFSAPSAYLGKQLMSYGGYLQYEINFNSGLSGTILF